MGRATRWPVPGSLPQGPPNPLPESRKGPALEPSPGLVGVPGVFRDSLEAGHR